MRVISRARSLDAGRHGWTADELEELMRLYSSQSCKRKVSWATAVTELDDPQFFLISSDSKADCLVAIARLGQRYVLEDGEGRPLWEGRDLVDGVKQAQCLLASRTKPTLVARLLIPLGCTWAIVEEKLEPLIPDSMEVMLPLASLV